MAIDGFNEGGFNHIDVLRPEANWTEQRRHKNSPSEMENYHAAPKGLPPAEFQEMLKIWDKATVRRSH